MKRTRAVFLLELAFHSARPLIWVLLALILFISYGLSSGNVTIASGDSTVGGRSKAWITSEFAVAQMLPLEAFILYVFFVAVAAGMAIPRDDELGVGPLLHSSRLTVREYMWGKFTAAVVIFLLVLTVHLALQILFNHLWPNENADKIRGPFELVNYVRPAVVFAIPCLFFFCGSSFAVGAITRTPILVFVMPVAFFLVSVFFLFDWSPTWLDPRINRIFMMIEPSGFRWINETWLKLDRGVEFYNSERVPYDVPFLLSRGAFAALGLMLVFFAERRFASGLRGETVRVRGAKQLAAQPALAEKDLEELWRAPLASLEMAIRPPSFLRTVLDVASFELQALRAQPGLYLFVPIILVQTVGNLFFEVGALDTPILLTPGSGAVLTLNTLSILLCLLILFYTVESVLRERKTDLAPIYYATPSRTAAFLLGKSIANGLIGSVILLAALIGVAIVLAVQGKVAFDIKPFLLVWGLLLVPTLLVWSAFVACVLAITGNRYVTYAIGLGAFAFTGWKQMRGEMNWVGNWDLWSAVTWSDFGSIAPNGFAVLLNRPFYIAVMAFLVTLTVRIFPRREHDSGRMLDRLRPKGVLRAILELWPVIVPAVALGVALTVQVNKGFQGKAAEKRDEEYWGRNFVTWMDADVPQLGAVDLDVALEPKRRSFSVRGHYDLVNATELPMSRFPMSVGDHFEKIEWTLDGEAFEPEDQAKLFVFKLASELAPGDTVRVGFSCEGRYPKGITKNGGGVPTFILPSGVVLTSFQSNFVPVPFFEEGRGVDKDNRTEPKDFEEDFFEGRTKPALGSGVRFPVRTKITGPAEYRYHGVGVKVEETEEAGRRTVVWQTDEPVNFFNIVAGRWEVWQGDGVEIYHHPKHGYNIAEMGKILEAAREKYSQWFYPYPWTELRINEFPGIARYAQGFPTNITFSESIGFLSRSTKEADAVFLVTAHETAHQWWGNILMPGYGPGGNVLAEGMANFSSILLFEELKGVEGRIEFCKRIEEKYGDQRRVDAEKPLVWIDGSKEGDETTTYDKGGWVFWMLHSLMGKEASLAGIQNFIGSYRTSVDFPVLQDYVRVMREFAPDSTAFDAFVKQWFFEVVAPEYRLEQLSKEEEGAGGWIVKATLKNVGSGTMPVEVAASRGTRFDEEKGEYRDARVGVVLGAGESREVEILCGFEPERVLVDPDALVLMLEREAAIAAL